MNLQSNAETPVVEEKGEVEMGTSPVKQPNRMQKQKPLTARLIVESLLIRKTQIKKRSWDFMPCIHTKRVVGSMRKGGFLSL
jgi:hypothetical protein